MSRATPSVVLLAAALAVACGRGGGGGDAPRDAGAPAAKPRTRVLEGNRPIAPPPTPPMPREVKATLVDAGAEPRARLRYRLDGDAERQVVATLEVTSRSLDERGWSERVALPRMRHGVAVRAERAPTGPRLLVRPLPVSVDAAADVAAQRLAAAQSERWRLIADRRVTVAIDERGRIARVAFADTPGDDGAPSATPSPARDELWQWLLGAVVPLPDEPVGAGARWKVRSVIRLGTATVEQLADYELVAAAGDTWTIEVVVRRIGEPQSAEAAGLPAGSIAELVGLFRETRGTLTVSAKDALPRSGRLDLELRVHARFHVPDQPMREVASEDVGTLSFGSE